MKRILPFALIAALFLAIGFIAGAGSTILIGSMSIVNDTTTNSPSVTLGNVMPNPGSLIISQLAISGTTNAFTVNLQWSGDNTNFFTVATWNPPTTNAGTFNWQPTVTAQPYYERVSVTTTNSVTNNIILNQ